MPLTRRNFLKKVGAAFAVAAVSPKIIYDFLRPKDNPLFSGALGHYSGVTFHHKHVIKPNPNVEDGRWILVNKESTKHLLI